MEPSLLVPLVAGLLSIVMTFAWVFQKRVGNAGWVDVFWSVAVGLAGLGFAVVPLDDGDALTPRQILVALLVLVWSVRLALHLAERASRGAEDARYANFRKHWGANFQRGLFNYVQLQALAALVLSLSVFAAARNPAPDLRPIDWIGAVLLLVAVAGAGLADRQLRNFRRAHSGERLVCDVGLWAWSRHPNYFFEWLGWVAYPLIAIASPAEYSWGWFALSGPIVMYWLLVHVLGIPYLEAQLVASRGEAYRAYQARTNPFFPWRPAASSATAEAEAREA